MLQRGQRLLVRSRALPQFFEGRNAGNRLQFLQLRRQFGIPVRPGFHGFLQAQFHDAVKFGPEQRLHDVLPLAGIRQQQTPEIALRQQDHLPELIAAKAEDSLHLRRHPLRFFRQHGQLPPRFVNPPDTGGFAHFHQPAGAAFPGQPLAGRPPHAVPFRSHREIEGHFGGFRIRRIIAAHILAASHLAAGIAVQGITHRIHQRGLAGTGRPMDEKKPVIAQLGKIDGLNVGIGAKRPDLQIKRLHRVSPPAPTTSSMIPVIVVRCCSVSAFWVDHSANASNSSRPDSAGRSERRSGERFRASC